MTPTLATIIQAVSIVTRVPADDLHAKCRSKAVAEARIALYVVARQCCHSYPAIGRAVGNRDHTTVVTGARRGLERLEVDVDFADAVALCLDLARTMQRKHVAAIRAETSRGWHECRGSGEERCA